MVYKMSKDNNFFDNINTENKAYHLGFMFADGNVSKTTNQITLKLHSQDIEQIKAFKTDLQLINKIAVHTCPKHIAYIQFYSHVTKQSLIKHGCVPCKSLIIKPPTNLPITLVPHFIRGYFDGDGCISILTRSTNQYIVCSFDVCGTLEILQWIKKSLGLTNKLYHTSNKNSYRLVTARTSSIINIHNYLYKDATIYLTRKKIKFDKALKLSQERIARNHHALKLNN